MSEKMRFKRLKSYIASLTRIWNDGVVERAETRQYKIIGQISDNIDGRQLAREVGWIGHDFDKVRFAIQVQYENHQTWVDLESSSTDWYAQRTDESYKEEIKALNKRIEDLQQGKQKLRNELQDEMQRRMAIEEGWTKKSFELNGVINNLNARITELVKERDALRVTWTEKDVQASRAEKGQLNDLVKQLQSQIEVLKDVIQEKMSC